MVTLPSDDKCKTVFSEGKIVNLQGARGPGPGCFARRNLMLIGRACRDQPELPEPALPPPQGQPLLHSGHGPWIPVRCCGQEALWDSCTARLHSGPSRFVTLFPTDHRSPHFWPQNLHPDQKGFHQLSPLPPHGMASAWE